MKRFILVVILVIVLVTSYANNKIEIPDYIEQLFEFEDGGDLNNKDIQNEQPKQIINEEKLETNQELLEMEDKMIGLVNGEREKDGLNKLELDEELRNVARIKSEDIAENDYFDHTSPTYGSPFEMMERFGIGFTQAAENLAGHGSVELAHEGLMNSQGHRENILRSGLTHIGIGIRPDEKYGYIFTQMFITKGR